MTKQDYILLMSKDKEIIELLTEQTKIQEETIKALKTIISLIAPEISLPE